MVRCVMDVSSTTTTCYCDCRYKRARVIAFAGDRCAPQVFVVMLLRGWRSFTAIATAATATTTAKSPRISIVRATATTLLSNQHRICFLSPQGIGRGGAATAAASRSAAFCTAPSAGDREGMENKEKINENGHGGGDDDQKKKDTMWHSFGVGYGTRSDEEGFGGIYGGSDATEDPEHHPNHPEYDQSQGSEVKEKEKARNLPDDAAATGHAHDQGVAAADKS